MKEILVIGGSGFIGRNIVKHLLNRGDCYVTAVDIKENKNLLNFLNDENTSKRFSFFLGDFSKKDSFLKLKKSFDEVYMLAAVVGVNKTLKNPQDVIKTNTMLTMNTLEWISRNPVKKILFSSSSENYAGTSDLFNINIPTDETVPLTISDIKHPRWTYAITKMHGESAFIHSALENKFESTIVRYQNIIGPEMGFGHAIPHIVERFINKIESPIKIYGHNQTRAFCYIDDAVNGTIKAMESSKANGEIYHIGNDQEISMKELTQFIGEILEYTGQYENAITYPGSVHRRCPDITKAEKDLGYKPKFDWKQAVEETVFWYKDFFKSGKKPAEGGFESPESFMK